MSNNSSVMGFDTERAVGGPFSGVNQNLGAALTFNPVMMVFDNQSTVAVAVYADTILWRTFPAGEALTVDCRANSGNLAANWTPPLGTQFSVVGTGGTGQFSLSIQYAR